MIDMIAVGKYRFVFQFIFCLGFAIAYHDGALFVLIGPFGLEIYRHDD